MFIFSSVILKRFRYLITFIFVATVFFSVYLAFDAPNSFLMWAFHRTGTIKHTNSKGQIDGQLIEYEDGKVVNTINYVSGLKQGASVKYFANGNMKNKIFFINDAAEGYEYEYYENGKLNYKRFWKNNKRFGNTVYYYMNAKPQIWYTYDKLGRNFFDIGFDTLGNIIKFAGHIMSSDIYSYSKKYDSFLLLQNKHTYNDIKDLYITIAEPADLDLYCFVKINDKVYDDIDVNQNTIKISNAFAHSGSYQILIGCQLKDKTAKLIKTDYYGETIIKE